MPRFLADLADASRARSGAHGTLHHPIKQGVPTLFAQGLDQRSRQSGDTILVALAGTQDDLLREVDILDMQLQALGDAQTDALALAMNADGRRPDRATSVEQSPALLDAANLAGSIGLIRLSTCRAVFSAFHRS